MASQFEKTFGRIAQFAGPVLGGIFGGPAGAALGGAAGGLLSGQRGTLRQAGLGALGGYGGAKLLGMGGSGGGGGISNLFSRFMGGGGSQGPQSALLSGVRQGSGSRILTSGNVNPAGTMMGGGGGSDPISKLFSGINSKTLLGTGIAAAGQLFSRSPKVPALPQSVVDFQNRARSGTALQGQAEQQLSGLLGQGFQDFSRGEEEAALRQLSRDEEDARNRVRMTYKSIRPGADLTQDSEFRRDMMDLDQRFGESKADLLAGIQRTARQDFMNTKINQITAARGMSTDQLNQMLEAANYDVDQVATQLGMDDRDRNSLREYLLEFGGNLAASGLGVQPQRSGFDKLLAQFGG